MINAQTWLDQEYPKKERAEVKELNIKRKSLEGELDLTDFVKLEWLNCADNKLTFLNVSNLRNLEKIECEKNQLGSIQTNGLTSLGYLSCWKNCLTDINSLLSGLNPDKLSILFLQRNTFSGSDLIPFSKFINLEQLSIHGNNFFGSLEPLRDLTKLNHLEIKNTDIDSGLEHLPNSLKYFECEGDKETKSTELYKKELGSFNGNIWIWKEFNSLAQKWLERKYPKNGLCQRGNDRDNYNKKRREEIIKLDISQSSELKGSLRLEEFTKLEKLDCCNTGISRLYLDDCFNLVKICCANSFITSLGFLKPVVKLEKLNISGCSSLRGSLEPLKNLRNLKELNISNTNINEGLEYLPESCKKLFCNSEEKYKSTEIMKELNKSKCFEEDETNNRYYNLDKWRENKQNDLAVEIISPERLFAIRSNLKQFINKWGKKGNDDLTELSKLQSPDELHSYYSWRIYTTQFVGRGSAVVGATLTFQDQSAIGGGILAVYPFSELVVSKLEKNLEEKKNKWKEFLSDADNFLDNYNGLLGMLAQFEVDKLKGGWVNEAIKDLDKKVKEFLKIYDENKNEEIDIDELTKERKTLVRDLDKEEKGSELWEIINSIKELEKAVIEYRRFSYYGSISSNDNSKENPNHLDSAIQQEEDLKTKLQEKINQLKEENQILEKEKDELEVQLKQTEIDYYKIKEELSEKENNLLLFEKQSEKKESEELVEVLKGEITTLNKNLSTTEKKINEIKEKLTRNKLVRLENWIKNFRNISWRQKISQGLGSTWDGIKYCVNKTYDFFTVPMWYWEQWKNRKLLINENQEQIASEVDVKDQNNNQESHENDTQSLKDENTTGANPSITEIKKRISHIRNSSDKEIAINLEENEHGGVTEQIIEIPPKNK